MTSFDIRVGEGWDIHQLVAGRRADRNPWAATTLEWSAPSPPIGHGNFEGPIAVYRGPYEYSVPGAAADYSLQAERPLSAVDGMAK